MEIGRGEYRTQLVGLILYTFELCIFFPFHGPKNWLFCNKNIMKIKCLSAFPSSIIKRQSKQENIVGGPYFAKL